MPTLVILLIIVGAIVVLLLWIMGSYNGLVALREQVRAAWAQIDVMLKRRHDLIPNVVETVKGYAAHEKGTLEAVINARNAALANNGPPAAQVQTENALTGAL